MLILMATGPAFADDVDDAAPLHPVAKAYVAKVNLDCVVRTDGGLKDCRVVNASPAGRAEADKVVQRFETEVYLKPGEAKSGDHKRFTFVWTKDAA
jgi:hypothetical protein